MLLAATREKPRRAASAVHVQRIARAGDGARPERQGVGRAARDVEVVVVAPERRDVREEEVRDEHRLRPAQVRVGRHGRVARARAPGRAGRRPGRRAPPAGPGSGASGRGGGRPTPARCATARCAAAGPPRRSARRASARRRRARLRRARRPRTGRAAASSRRPRSPSAMHGRVGDRTRPRRRCASTQARLPRMSSSTRRRSNGNDRPELEDVAVGLAGEPSGPEVGHASEPDPVRHHRGPRVSREPIPRRSARRRRPHRGRLPGRRLEPRRLARDRLDRQPPQLDEPLGRGVVERVPRLVGGQRVVVERERRPASDDPAFALEQPQPHLARSPAPASSRRTRRSPGASA